MNKLFVQEIFRGNLELIYFVKEFRIDLMYVKNSMVEIYVQSYRKFSEIFAKTLEDHENFLGKIQINTDEMKRMKRPR